MKGYLDSKTQELVRERRKLLDKLEVLSFQIQEHNKKITHSLFDSLAGKEVKFYEYNRVLCKNREDKEFPRMPDNEAFLVIEAGIANTMDDIFYVLRGKMTNQEYIIRQMEFNDFEFIN